MLFLLRCQHHQHLQPLQLIITCKIRLLILLMHQMLQKIAIIMAHLQTQPSLQLVKPTPIAPTYKYQRPPLSKMGRDANHYTPLPHTSCNAQVRTILLGRSRLDKNNTSKQTPQRINQLQYADISTLSILINVIEQHKICFR